MTISINTNFAAMLAQRGLNNSTKALGTSMQRLSTGLKINSAQDDSAGLAVANRLMTQVRGLSVAKRNTSEGMALADLASAALTETTNAIQNIRDLAVEASSSTRSDADRDALQLNVDELLAEITRIATDTKYNNVALLDGTYAAKPFQIGANKGETINVTIGDATLPTLFNLKINTQVLASDAIATLDTAIESVNSIQSQLSGSQSRFNSITNVATATSDAYTAARSSIMDADIAQETTNMTRYSIIQQAGIAVLAQANQQPQALIKLLG
ncbi:MAG: flagellin FliC [Magnetococcales bacterium]|nr:flagellin FliC [Magnetococcales bacterium]